MAPRKDQDIADLARDLHAHATWISEAGATDLPVLTRNAGEPSGALKPTPQARASAAPERAPPATAAPPTRPTQTALGPPPVHPLATSSAAPAPTSANAVTLAQVRTDLGECTRCRLHAQRTHIVFGVGNPKAELVFVGEGPGADEDAKGEPFVGRAGQLLDKMIEAMGLHRTDVYICNVVKCRPPENRAPEPDEMAQCLPFLRAQLGAIGPKVIVVLGKTAAQALLDDKTPITRLRGRWREYAGIPLMPTFHPAYLLRSPGEKAKVWEDLKAVVRHLGRELPTR